METLNQVLSVNLDKIPVVSTNRFIPRKEQAKLARDLFKRLGIKGVSVTAPNYSMAQSVDVRIPELPTMPEDFLLDGKDYDDETFSRMPEALPAKMKMRQHQKAVDKMYALLLRAFPASDDRSDVQTDYFNYKWSVS